MRKFLGILFILLGILGGFLPILPGFVFFFTGVALISPKLEVKMRIVYNRYKCHGKLSLAAKEFTLLFVPEKLQSICKIKKRPTLS